MTLDDAIIKIKELEEENQFLREKVAELEKQKNAGRPKHDSKWQESYDAWKALYENGMNMEVILEKTEISRRTYYRYKAYYDAVKAGR